MMPDLRERKSIPTWNPMGRTSFRSRKRKKKERKSNSSDVALAAHCRDIRTWDFMPCRVFWAMHKAKQEMCKSAKEGTATASQPLWSGVNL